MGQDSQEGERQLDPIQRRKWVINTTPTNSRQWVAASEGRLLVGMLAQDQAWQPEWEPVSPTPRPPCADHGRIL
jgi:hypothetical protein